MKSLIYKQLPTLNQTQLTTRENLEREETIAETVGSPGLWVMGKVGDPEEQETPKSRRWQTWWRRLCGELVGRRKHRPGSNTCLRRGRQSVPGFPGAPEQCIEVSKTTLVLERDTDVTDRQSDLSGSDLGGQHQPCDVPMIGGCTKAATAKEPPTQGQSEGVTS